MDFTKNFRQVWWLMLVIVIGAYLFDRYTQSPLTGLTTVDALIFVVWIALCVAPLFKEIELPGIKLKQEVDKLKKEIEGIKNDNTNSQHVDSHVAPTFVLNIPTQDSVLSQIESLVKKNIDETLGNQLPTIIESIDRQRIEERSVSKPGKEDEAGSVIENESCPPE